MKPFIEIAHIAKTYRSSKGKETPALKGVSLEINQGEIFSLLGVNGAGKSTLSSILCGLHPPTSGDIRFCGESIYKNIQVYKSQVGYCPQKPNLDRFFNIRETLIFSGRCYGLTKEQATQRCDELLVDLQLTQYAKSYSIELSGGYKQRFLIARTLMHSPKFIILDEPTVGLDPHIRHQLWEVIKGLKEKGTTVLLTTHYLDEAEVLSDRVCFIHDGEVLSLDTPQNLMKKHNKKRLEDVFILFVNENLIDSMEGSHEV